KADADKFAACVADVFYEFSRRMNDESTRNETLTALGENYSGMAVDDMNTIVQQTKFYATPEDAVGLFTGEKFQKTTTPMISEFCASHEMLSKKPRVGFDDDTAQLNYSTATLKSVQ
ncbi:MAG: hypothetical protein AAFP90_24045, partial [Planctomycetota bacterium]